jgi:hypothetical protein
MAEGHVPQTEIDASLVDRSQLDVWSTTLRLDENAADRTVLAAGRAPRAAPGSRTVRAAADVTTLDAGARSNWIPTGPRNITGRIRALAAHPTDPASMYAGSASGGVFKSIDGGETWAPSWTDDASLAIGAIGVCRSHPEVVWAATGEVSTGGNESILGTGIYRSADAGQTWTNSAAPHVPGAAPDLGTSFDAVAAHPNDATVCWAVGPAGVFRTRDSGAHWTQFENGTYYSDAAFAVSGANVFLFLVRAVSAAGEASVVRLDNSDDPDDAHIRTAIADLSNESQPIPVPVVAPSTAQSPARGKIALCAGTPAVAFVRFVLAGDGDPGAERHAGLFRTRNALDPPAGGASAVQWTQLPDDPSWLGTAPDGSAAEGQGMYDLSIGVDPDHPDNLATGMLNVQVSTNANGPSGAVTYKRVIAEDLTFLDRAHHGDQHVALFVPPAGGAPTTLWVANDGGLARSIDWHDGAGFPPGATLLPLPVGAVTWRKSFGISAAQPYSLSQSPLLPTSFGCGFQDNGVLMTSGGPTWRVVLGADGGFLAFDPDDPYKALATWQSGIAELLFPGQLEGGFPLPGYPVRDGVWPRTLTQGFLPGDGALFVSDTAHHPRRGDRVLHARNNRLYGSTETSGDRWQPEPAGRGIELQLSAQPTTATPNAAVQLEVRTSDGAAKLGLAPQISFFFGAPGDSVTTVVRNIRPGPYDLVAGDFVDLVVTRVPPAGAALNIRVTFDRNGAWSTAQVAERFTRHNLGLEAYGCFWARPTHVEITTTDVGPNAQISLGGTALNPPSPTALSPLQLRARTYHGSAGRPATVTLRAPSGGMAAPTGQPPLQLTVQIGAAGPTRTITFDAATFADVGWIHAGDLEQAIHTSLQNDPATATAVAAQKLLVITGTGGHRLRLGGTALPRLHVRTTIPAAPPFSYVVCRTAIVNSFDLTPATAAPTTPLVLTLDDGTPKASLTFAGSVNDLRAITAEELQGRLNDHFAAHAINAHCDLAFVYDDGHPAEIAYSRSAPDTAWVGSTDGTLYHTANDGAAWETIQDPAIHRLDRQVEAIAIHPTDPATVYVGLEGRPTAGLEDQAALTAPGLLFKTSNGGSSWNHVGADVKDAAGSLLGVYALQIDPAAPETVFAATEVGVFRTIDGGAGWQPFNEGLPNAIVRDLDFVAERRVLRAGVWGRGTFEREVGAPAPRDVTVYVRAGEFDTGSVRPAARGPDLIAAHPRSLPRTASPDIKVNRDDPPSITGLAVIDGVEFDDDILHEDVVAGDATIFVQVHNRGAFDATGVRLALLWTDASVGPPPLPADFWTQFRAGPLGGDVGAWHVVGDSALDDPAGKGRDHVPPGYPRVKRFAVHWPDDVATHRRIGILLLAESAEDRLDSTDLDIGALLERERRAAYRETATRQTREDQTVRVEQTSSAQFTISDPPGPLAPATALLAAADTLPLGPKPAVVGDTQQTFALAPAGGNDQALTISLPVETVTISFDSGIGDPAHATLGEVLNILRHTLFRAGVPVAVDEAAANAGTLRLIAGGSATFNATAAGTATANLGFAIGAPAPALPGGPAPYNLAGGGQTLVLSVAKQTTVRFSLQPGFDPNAATARSVRRLLNREFATAHLPLRAVSPHTELWIRRSITDIDGTPSPVAGRQLADLVVESAAVPADGRSALFDLVRVHRADPVQAAHDNFLYLRVANLGNTDLASDDARHRFFALAVAASPIGLTAIGDADGISQAVPGRGSAIIEAPWNPGPAAAGDRLFVLVASDDRHHAQLLKDGVPLGPATTFATVDELDEFCIANPGVAYRTFTVTA